MGGFPRCSRVAGTGPRRGNYFSRRQDHAAEPWAGEADYLKRALMENALCGTHRGLGACLVAQASRESPLLHPRSAWGGGPQAVSYSPPEYVPAL